jgi:hypothetical protein
MEVQAGKNDGVVPPVITVLLSGDRKVEVRPVKFTKFDDMLQAAGPLIEFFERDYKERIVKGLAAAPQPTPKDEPAKAPVDWAKLDVVSIMKLLPGTAKKIVEVGAPGLNIEELEMDEGLQVFSAIVQVNLSFFIQRVLPALGGSLQGIANGIIGSTFAKTSSPPTTH